MWPDTRSPEWVASTGNLDRGIADGGSRAAWRREPEDSFSGSACRHWAAAETRCMDAVCVAANSRRTWLADRRRTAHNTAIRGMTSGGAERKLAAYSGRIAGHCRGLPWHTSRKEGQNQTGTLVPVVQGGPSGYGIHPRGPELRGSIPKSADLRQELSSRPFPRTNRLFSTDECRDATRPSQK